MSKTLKWSMISVMVLGAVIVIVLGFLKLRSPEKKEEHHYTIMELTEQEPLVLDGNIETAKEQSYHVDPQKGQVAEVKVTDGQEVDAGDVLFEYDNETISDEVADLNRQVSRLISERDRLYQELETQKNRKAQAKQELEKEVPTQNQQGTANQTAHVGAMDTTAFDQAIEGTQKAIRDMNNNIEDVNTKIERLSKKTSSSVTADIAGTISINPEGKTNVQLAFVKITSKDSEVKTTVSEYDYESVEKGTPVTVYVKAQDREIKGTISFVSTDPSGSGASPVPALPSSPSTASSSGSHGVARYDVIVKPEISLPNGFTVQVKIPQKGLVLTEQAIQKDGEQEYVYLYENGVAKRKNIKRVKKGFQWIVQEGLSIGDKVIANPDSDITDGAAVSSTQLEESVKSHD